MERFKDRTSEFRSAHDLAQSRLAATSDVKRPLLANGSAQAGGSKGASSRTDFARMAGKIGKDLQGTTAKLEKLAQLAKRKTLFDDRPVEISELTYIIKQDIAGLNQQIAQLQSFTQANFPPSNGAAGKQVNEHNTNVVMMLQSKLADTSIGFKDVLEIRTQNMKASRDRTEQFTFQGQPGGQQGIPTSVLRARKPSQPLPDLATDSPLYRSSSRAEQKGKGRETPQPPGGPQAKGNADFLALDMGTPDQPGTGQNSEGFMQMQLVEQQDTYIQSRSTAIDSIESTIAELGQIFSQLATMVAQQGEQVTRIDADTDEIATNVGGAQQELLKYYASVASNRWLMAKVFGVLVIFFLLFVLVS